MSDGRATLSWPRGPAALRALTLTAPDGKGVVGQGQSGGPVPAISAAAVQFDILRTWRIPSTG